MQLLVLCGCTQLVEYVVAPLPQGMADTPGLLQEVSPHVGASDGMDAVKPDVQILTKPAAIVVTHSLGITNGLRGWGRGCNAYVLIDLGLNGNLCMSGYHFCCCSC